MVIIGSTCLKHHFEDFPRLPEDIDYLVPNKNILVNVPGKVEYHENEVLWSNFITHNTFPKYLPINLLYTLKIHTMFYNEHMYKDFDDYIQNSILANLIKDKVEFYYPDKIPESFTYLTDNGIDYNLDPISKPFHYLFKYFWVQKQLEE